MRRLRVRFSFKASARAWRSTITTEPGHAAHTDQLNPRNVGHVTFSQIRFCLTLELCCNIYCDSFMPPSQPADKVDKLETCNRFILVPEVTAMTPIMTTYLHTEQKRETLRFHVFDMFQTDVTLSVTSTTRRGPAKGGWPRWVDWMIRRLATRRAWQGPGLSPFVAKIVSAQVEVGDGRAGLQRCGNVLAKTKHDLATFQFGELFWTKRCQYETRNRPQTVNHLHKTPNI